MRLLFLTNFYPPASRGGYEQWCQEVAEGLRAKGHEVVILTSRHDRDSIPQLEPAWVVRDLYLEMEFASLRNAIQFFTHRKGHANVNLARLRQAVKEFMPDIVLVWGMWNLPRSLPALAEDLMPERIAYYMGDYWPTLPTQFMFYWQQSARHWSSALIKKFLGAIALHMLANEKTPELKLARIMFPTAFMRNELKRQGVVPQSSAIIYGAVDTSLYWSLDRSLHKPLDQGLTLLYVGRLAREKGVHTAIQALGELVHQRGYSNVKLHIVGTGEPDYEQRLHDVAALEKVQSHITFLGMQPKETMPAIYSQADVLLFTSLWDEPFGRVLVEAMAAGLVVVGTRTGGSAEILIDNENALTFSSGDASGLAAQIARLIEFPELGQQLAYRGRRQAKEKFDIQRMVNEVEAFLQGLLNEP